jgi:hypothetical protein
VIGKPYSAKQSFRTADSHKFLDISGVSLEALAKKEVKRQSSMILDLTQPRRVGLANAAVAC